MHIGLRYKFTLAFMVFTLLVATIFGMITSQRMASQLRDQYERYARQVTAHASEEALETLLFDVGHDLPLLARNQLSENVIYLQIVIGNRIWAEEHTAGSPLPLLPEPAQPRVATVLRGKDVGDHLDIVQPLRSAVGDLLKSGHLMDAESQRRIREGIRGYVRLGLLLKPMQQRVQREALLLTGVSLGLMVVGILFGWTLSHMILTPLERLSSAVRDFGAGNARARAHITSGDEIESLAHEFNTMAKSIVFQRDALKESNEQLQKSNRVKATFLATISHELRTPLHAIVGYASLLRDGVNVTLNDAGHKYTEAILRGGKHLLALIGNLIAFSRSESGAEPLRPLRVQIAELVQEVLDNQRPLLEGKELSLVSDVEPDLTLNVDRVKLEQVLLNLLNNAIKYTDQGQIWVAVRDEGRGLSFEVGDTGTGIAPGTRATLFDPFTRGKTPAHNNEGLGLGLAVVKRNVELLGGHIQFESTLGKGSTFHFTLPKGGPDEAADR